jgi:hypothetical protein
MLMHAKRKQNTMRYQQSEGNVALADENLHVLQNPKDKTLSPMLRPVPAITEEYSEGDTPSPAKGSVGVIGLWVMLWWLIILVIYWIHFSLQQSSL